MKILIVLGTRPEIIRLNLIIKKLAKIGIKTITVYTGQNYNSRLSKIFFKELNLPFFNYYLNVKSNSLSLQISKILEGTEKISQIEKPDLFLVLGDTNSALSAIMAARYNIDVIHLEAGNRCYDWKVPEEKNRKIIDHISTFLCPYTERSKSNLLKEGIDEKYIFVTGNPITEVLNEFQEKIEKSNILKRLRLKKNDYFLLTLHREENVDDKEVFKTIIQGINLIAKTFKKRIIVSLHPRTAKRLSQYNISLNPRIEIYKPLGFFDFTFLEKNSLCVLTDSGTVQEECSLFHVPTVTVRNTTERPETVECGSNILSGTNDPSKILEAVKIAVYSSRDWVSPYSQDFNVSEKVLKIITTVKPLK